MPNDNPPPLSVLSTTASISKHSPDQFAKPDRNNSNNPSRQERMNTSGDAGSDFTPNMRDRQSRGKNPYHEDGSDNDDVPEIYVAHPAFVSSSMRANKRADKDRDFGSMERRHQAIAYLDNPELLMNYAQSTGDSIPAARLHFMKMMCGYDKEVPEETRQGGSRSRRHQQEQPDRDVDKRRGGDRAAGR